MSRFLVLSVLSTLAVAVAAQSSAAPHGGTDASYTILLNDADAHQGFLWPGPRDGDIAVCASNISLVNVKSKTIQWSVATPNEVSTNHACTFAVTVDAVYRASSTEGVSKRSLKDGSLVWSNTNLQACYGPTFADGLVYVSCPSISSNSPGLFALDPATGKVTWNDTSISPASRVSAMPGYLILADSTRGLLVMTRPDHVIVWSNSTINPSVSGSSMAIALSPFAGDSFFVIWSASQVTQTVTKIALSDGQVKWEVDGLQMTPTQSTSSQSTSSSMFAAGNSDVLVYNGTRVLRLSAFDGSVSSQTPESLNFEYGDGILVDSDTVLNFYTMVGGPLVVNFDGFGNFDKNLTFGGTIVDGNHLSATPSGLKNQLVFLTVQSSSLAIEGYYIK